MNIATNGEVGRRHGGGWTDIKYINNLDDILGTKDGVDAAVIATCGVPGSTGSGS